MGRSARAAEGGERRKKCGSWGGPRLRTPPPKCPAAEAVVGQSPTGLSGGQRLLRGCQEGTESIGSPPKVGGPDRGTRA